MRRMKGFQGFGVEGEGLEIGELIGSDVDIPALQLRQVQCRTATDSHACCHDNLTETLLGTTLVILALFVPV